MKLGINNAWYYAECRVLFIVMLNVIVLSVVMLSVVILSVVMLSGMAPFWRHNSIFRLGIPFRFFGGQTSKLLVESHPLSHVYPTINLRTLGSLYWGLLVYRVCIKNTSFSSLLNYEPNKLVLHYTLLERLPNVVAYFGQLICC